MCYTTGWKQCQWPRTCCECADNSTISRALTKMHPLEHSAVTFGEKRRHLWRNIWNGTNEAHLILFELIESFVKRPEVLFTTCMLPFTTPSVRQHCLKRGWYMTTYSFWYREALWFSQVSKGTNGSSPLFCSPTNTLVATQTRQMFSLSNQFHSTPETHHAFFSLTATLLTASSLCNNHNITVIILWYRQSTLTARCMCLLLEIITTCCSTAIFTALSKSSMPKKHYQDHSQVC